MTHERDRFTVALFFFVFVTLSAFNWSATNHDKMDGHVPENEMDNIEIVRSFGTGPYPTSYTSYSDANPRGMHSIKGTIVVLDQYTMIGNITGLPPGMMPTFRHTRIPYTKLVSNADETMVIGFSEGGGFGIYDFTDPLNPGLLFEQESSGTYETEHALAIVNDTFFMVYNGYFGSFNLTATITQQATVPIANVSCPYSTSGTTNLVRVGNFLYASLTGHVVMFDITSPSSLSFQSKGVYITGHLYHKGSNLILVGESGMQVFSVDDPANPVLVAQSTNAEARGF
nr:hypothetical protein [Candidatus Sigynarchaeota archaeon]